MKKYPKKLQIKQFGKTFNVECSITEYQDNNNTAIVIDDIDDNSMYAIATINVIPLEKDLAVIKTYSEGEGILEFLVENNIVKVTGKYIQTGFVSCPIVKINLDLFTEEVEVN